MAAAFGDGGSAANVEKIDWCLPGHSGGGPGVRVRVWIACVDSWCG